MRALLPSLEDELQHPPPGLDVFALTTFVHLLSQAVCESPSTRFDGARFGNITRDAGGGLVGHVGLGVDVVGTIHDACGFVTFEQHPVPLQPGAFRPLSSADRASLAAALEKFIASATPPADPLWGTLLHDLTR
jgi:hypothetical protein